MPQDQRRLHVKSISANGTRWFWYRFNSFELKLSCEAYIPCNFRGNTHPTTTHDKTVCLSIAIERYDNPESLNEFDIHQTINLLLLHNGAAFCCCFLFLPLLIVAGNRNLNVADFVPLCCCVSLLLLPIHQIRVSAEPGVCSGDWCRKTQMLWAENNIVV